MNFFSASFLRKMFSAYKDDCDWLACGAMTDERAGGGGGGGGGGGWGGGGGGEGNVQLKPSK